MGDSEEGGGGSVEWKLQAKNASKAKHGHEKKSDDKHEINQDGTDEDGKVGNHFTVSFLKPSNQTQQEFIDHLRSPNGLKASTKDPNRVYFNLKIVEKTPAQIRVSWGDSDNHEGTALQELLALLEERKKIASS